MIAFQLPLRQQTIVRLLETHRDAVGNATLSGEGTTDRGDRLLLMSELWHGGSYAELEEVLKAMRQERPSQYWHVSERYLRSKLCRRTVKYRKTMRMGRTVREPILGPHQAHAYGAIESGDKEATIQVWEWRAEVRNEKVRRGLEWIDNEFERRYVKAKQAGAENFWRWQPQLPDVLSETRVA